MKPREVKIDIEEPTRHRLNTIERGHSKSLSKGRDSSFRIAWKNVNNTLGVVHVDKIRFLATIGGMSLETVVDSVNLSVFKKFDVLEQKFAGGTLRRRG